MPPQIKRHLIVLAVFVALFMLLRHLLLPESFGEIGHYRAKSLMDNEMKEMHYAGEATCTECHEETSDLKGTDLHAELSCETCHGPGLTHVDSQDAADIQKPQSREFCGKCHALHYARNRKVVSQVELTEHNTEHECIYCHNPHAPWELRNQETPEEGL